MENVIKLKNVSFGVKGKKIVEDISFCVEKGEIFVLCGESGAGKTTVMKLITGEFSPSSGDILINGRSVLSLPMQKRGAVLVTQGNDLFPHLSVYENVAFALKSRRIGKDEIKRRVRELSEDFGLSDHLNDLPASLSGGQQKLCAIIRALGTDPAVLLLDEPFTGLDNNLHLRIRRYILDHHQKKGTTIVMITHNREDVFFMGTRAAFLEKGKLVYCSEVSRLYDGTGQPYVDGFLGKMIRLPDGRYVFEDEILP